MFWNTLKTLEIRVKCALTAALDPSAREARECGNSGAGRLRAGPAIRHLRHA